MPDKVKVEPVDDTTQASKSSKDSQNNAKHEVIDISDESIHRLEGSTDRRGGLIKKASSSNKLTQSASLLGLDKLGEEKARERERQYRRPDYSQTPGNVSESVRANVAR